MKPSDLIPIGQLASRAGVSVSAIRFYETKGLLHSHRNAGNQRRFLRSDVRRLSFILITQQLGLSIEEIVGILSTLPDNRTPTKKDWARLSNALRQRLDEQIETLIRTRERLDECIGCGCLSLKACQLWNPEDRAARLGPGARYLLDKDGVKKAKAAAES